MPISNSKFDKLGKRLCLESKEEDDFKLLEVFRESFEQVDNEVYGVIENCFKDETCVSITKRKTKTQQSIIDKLKRESSRLSQIQDIRGCRIVVDGTIKQQDKIKDKLMNCLKGIGRQLVRPRNSHIGYRAIHIIVKKGGRYYEIQLRTLLQDVWANMMEDLSKKDYNLKYGNGNASVQEKMKCLADKFFKKDQQDNYNLDKFEIEQVISQTINE